MIYCSAYVHRLTFTVLRSLFLLAIFFFQLSFSTFASELPVTIKAEQLKFVEGSGQIEAAGSVEVKFKATTIYADRLVLDSATNIATAEGNVILLTHDYQANAAQLTYDTSEEIGTFKGFHARFTPQKLRGNIYVFANRLHDLKDKMEGAGGTISTCDNQLEHYFLRADQVTYYPEEKIMGRNVTIYVGEQPVMWLPYFYYEFKQRQRNWVYGHNDVEGDYLKTTWGYPGGTFLYDLMEKKGTGVGVNTQLTSALGAGALSLYLLDEKDTKLNDRIFKLDQTKQITPQTTLSWNQSYLSTYRIPSGRLEQSSTGLNLNYKDKASWRVGLNTTEDRSSSYQHYALSLSQAYERVTTNYSMNYEFTKADPRWMRNSIDFSHQRSLFSDNVTLDTAVSYYRGTASEADAGEERLLPQLNLRGSVRSFNWRYSQNWFVDMKKDLSPTEPRYEFLEKQPELEIAAPKVDLRLCELQSNYSYGRYREVKYVAELGKKRDFTTERYRATLDAGKSIGLGLGTVLNLGAGLDQYSYATQDQFFVYRENAGLRTDLGTCFRNELNYRKGISNGNSPFIFDKTGSSYHDATERITFYYKDKFSWAFDGGRNWQTNKWFDLMTNIMVAPDQRVRWDANTGWDIENQKYRDLSTALKLSPYSFFSSSFSVVRDLNVGEFRSASAFYDLTLLPGEPNQLRVQLNQTLDPTTKEFKVRDIMVIHELHCWEMKFSYSDYRKEISFIFSLKALPEEPIGFNPGRGFYYEGLERQLSSFKSAGEVRRY